MDMESKGYAFTWTNNRDGDELVKKKLDRALCNMKWRVLFPNVAAYALLAIGSNHCSIILSLDLAKTRKQKIFIFEAF